MKQGNVEKKAAAKQLFMSGNEQRFISGVLGISEKTISNWATTENWAMQRANRNTAEMSIQDDVLYMINRLTSEKRKMLQEADAETIINLDGKFADAIHKMWSIVKEKETPINVITKNITAFLKFLQAYDLDLAKKVMPYTRDYLEAVRKPD